MAARGIRKLLDEQSLLLHIAHIIAKKIGRREKMPRRLDEEPLTHTLGRLMIISQLFFETQLGVCGIEWSETVVTRFRLPDKKPAAESSEVPAWVGMIKERVQLHLAGDFQDFTDVPLDYTRVSSFQRAVYEASLTVKAGSTRTYGWLASAIGQPVAISRAVGTALGQNPWPLLVPCHRFVSADGKMAGFSAPGGIKTKLRLLALEGAEMFAE